MYNKSACSKSDNGSHILLLMGSRVRMHRCILSKPRLPILSGVQL